MFLFKMGISKYWNLSWNMMPTFLCCHWALLQKNSCDKNFIITSWLENSQFWKTSKMSHSYILQSFKRYKRPVWLNVTIKKFMNQFFWLPYICTKTYRKFYEPLWKPIFGKQIPNFLCHTVQKALFPNGIKSPIWS